MSHPSNAVDPWAAQSRREFVKGLGVGAFGVSMLGGGRLLADEPNSSQADPMLYNELFEASEANGPEGCQIALWSVDRQARLDGEIDVVRCDPCDCPPYGHINFVTQINFTTTFAPVSICDELGIFEIGDVGKMRWFLKNRYLRVNGPCQTPIGHNSGTFTIFDVNNRPIFRGRVFGTLGFDPCLPPGPPRCCEYPRVMGMLVGGGVSGSLAEGCILRLSYCGFEGPEPCQEMFWDVGVTGIVRCPCPGDLQD